mgnify:CR=1 FL=1
MRIKDIRIRNFKSIREIHIPDIEQALILDMAHSHQLYFTVDDADTIWFRRGA